MSRQISFIFEGTAYFTFIGSNYIQSTLQSNAAPLGELSSKPSFSAEMRKLNDGSPRFASDFPVVKDAKVEKKDGYFFVTGTIIKDGVQAAVTLTKDDIKFERIGGEPEAPKEVTKNETPKQDQQPVGKKQEVKQDKMPDTAPKDKQTVAKGSEEKKDSAKAATVEKTAPKKKEIKAEKPASAETVQKQPAAAPIVERKQSIAPATTGTGKKKYTGFTFGRNDGQSVTKVNLGVPDEVLGCVFRGAGNVPTRPRRQQLVRNNSPRRGNGRVPESTARIPQQSAYQTNAYQQSAYQQNAPIYDPKQTSYRTQSNVEKTEGAVDEVVRRIEPSPKVELKVPTVERDEETVAPWARNTGIGDRGTPETPPMSAERAIEEARKANGLDEERRSMPLPIIQETEDVVLPEKDRDTMKREVRATFSPGVNKVIGDIPPDMLGNIDEFTTNPVDVEQLHTDGNMFCINRRWLKAGNWFCIDVIPNKARYFYNAKKGVSIEIPLKDLRAWAEVIA